MSESLRIVPAAPDHLDQWREVHNEVIPTSPLSAEEVAERATRNRLTVAFVGDRLAGCATVRPPAGESRTATVIVRLLPPFRGRGLGSAYLDVALRDARALDPGRIETVVLSSNVDGLAFARRHGFVEHDRYVVDGESVAFVDLHLPD